MPVFGEFETIEEPLCTREEGGSVYTIWKAKRRTAVEDRVYAIKALAVDRRQKAGTVGSSAPATQASPDRQFIEAVKLQNQGYQGNNEVLAPVHGYGTTDAGAWYATDYYPRKGLKEFIALHGESDAKGLEHVVYTTVIGCLALQRFTGRSHGNLKPSNILLCGKPRPLAYTPLHLIDPSPTSALAAPIPGRTHTDLPKTESGPREQTELRDLRAVGELILQLAEGRITAGPYDYNFPITPSPAWDKLGKSAEKWRELCNRLLDPKLSLANISLDALAKDLQPRPYPAGLVKGAVAGAAVLLVMLGATALHLFKGESRPPVAEPRQPAAARVEDTAADQGKTPPQLDKPTVTLPPAESLKPVVGTSRTTQAGTAAPATELVELSSPPADVRSTTASGPPAAGLVQTATPVPTEQALPKTNLATASKPEEPVIHDAPAPTPVPAPAPVLTRTDQPTTVQTAEQSPISRAAEPATEPAPPAKPAAGQSEPIAEAAQKAQQPTNAAPQAVSLPKPPENVVVVQPPAEPRVTNVAVAPEKIDMRDLDTRLAAMERKANWGTLVAPQAALEDLEKIRAAYTAAGRLPGEKKLHNRIETLRAKIMRLGGAGRGPAPVPQQPYVQPIHPH